MSFFGRDPAPRWVADLQNEEITERKEMPVRSAHRRHPRSAKSILDFSTDGKQITVVIGPQAIKILECAIGPVVI